MISKVFALQVLLKLLYDAKGSFLPTENNNYVEYPAISRSITAMHMTILFGLISWWVLFCPV